MTTQPSSVGEWGSRTIADGSSRDIDDATTDPRMVIARYLARADGWAEIRPGHWAKAGAIVKALKAAGQLIDRRRRAPRAE
jgi:hypothetical protein